MNLRCRDGDIAVITWDFPECLSNVGRLVQVRGPVRCLDSGPGWSIKPVTPELYTLREVDGSFTREQVTWQSRVLHPDAWMVPIRPEHTQRLSTSADEVADIHALRVGDLVSGGTP